MFKTGVHYDWISLINRIKATIRWLKKQLFFTRKYEFASSMRSIVVIYCSFQGLRYWKSFQRMVLRLHLFTASLFLLSFWRLPYSGPTSKHCLTTHQCSSSQVAQFSPTVFVLPCYVDVSIISSSMKGHSYRVWLHQNLSSRSPVHGSVRKKCGREQPILTQNADIWLISMTAHVSIPYLLWSAVITKGGLVRVAGYGSFTRPIQKRII